MQGTGETTRAPFNFLFLAIYNIPSTVCTCGGSNASGGQRSSSAFPRNSKHFKWARTTGSGGGVCRPKLDHIICGGAKWAGKTGTVVHTKCRSLGTQASLKRTKANVLPLPLLLLLPPPPLAPTSLERSDASCDQPGGTCVGTMRKALNCLAKEGS